MTAEIRFGPRLPIDEEFDTPSQGKDWQEERDETPPAGADGGWAPSTGANEDDEMFQ